MATLGSHSETRPKRHSVRWILGILGLAVAVLMLLPVGVPGTPSAMLVGSAVAVAVALAAYATWQGRNDRHRYEGWLAAQAAEDAKVELRLALARDLHDKVSHALGFIVVHASVAQHLGDRRSETLMAALGEVEEAGREALSDLRELISVFYGGTDSADVDPDIDLEATVRRHTNFGTGITCSGEPLEHLPQPARQLIAPLIRESLVNVARYAGPTQVHIETAIMEDGISVVVSDDGPVEGWRACPGTGNGLELLRHRFESVAGSLSWHRREDGGFTVAAMVPSEDVLKSTYEQAECQIPNDPIKST